MAKKTLSKAYNPEVDFWKLFFASVVFLMHTKVFFSASPILRRGYIAVEFFFIVSGYFLAAKVRSDARKELRIPTSEFLRHKLAGLFKIVLCAFLITFAVREFGAFQSVPTTARNFFLGVYEVIFGRAYGLAITKSYNEPVWYIASMLASMTVLYPLAAKYRTQFFRVACPVIALFSYSVILRQTKILKVTEHTLFGLLIGGTLRAFAGLCVGMFVNECCVCAKEALAGKRVSGVGKVLFFLTEIADIVGILFYMQIADKLHWSQKYDYALIPALALFCFLVFSELTGVKERLQGVNFAPLSKLSLYLYLCQWPGTYILKGRLGEGLTFGKAVLYQIVITAASMALCRLLVFLIDLIGKCVVPKLKRLLFVPQ
ncbi:MAG: acyltransferase family protein [Clostridia bacterium]|nr:acyltransferase family protein [Clostridia bacterium]